MNTTPLSHWLATLPTWGKLTAAAVALTLASALAVLLVRKLRRVDIADLIMGLIALAGTVYAATGTWKYLTDSMGYDTLLKSFLVIVLEGAQIAEALRVRKNIREFGAAGIDGAGLWVLTLISAALSTSVAGSIREGMGRALVPLVGAWLWERALAPARRANRERRQAGPVRWRVTPERIAVWLRLADAIDTDIVTVDSARRVAKFLRVTDRERDGWRWPFTAKARAYRGRMKLIGDALRHGDPTEVHAKLSRSAFDDALRRLGIAEPTGDDSARTESPAPVEGESPAPVVTQMVSQPVSQKVSLLTPEHPVFAKVVASLPPVANGTPKTRRTAAASTSARRQAAVSARVGVDRDSAMQTYRKSVADGAPLSSRDLAKAAGVSQSTASRIIAEVNAEAA